MTDTVHSFETSVRESQIAHGQSLYFRLLSVVRIIVFIAENTWLI
jgi:hypothetical protein